MNIKTLLCDEVQEELDILNQIGVGTENHKLATEDVTKLVDRIIDLEKIEIERKEYELKLAQMEEDKKGRWIKDGISVFGILVPAGVAIWGTLKTFKFEETGTVTGIIGRGWINKLLPKK